jgi:hypothetical protein
VAAVNLTGCVLFGISAAAAYIVPATGSVLDLAAANWTTALGALCFPDRGGDGLPARRRRAGGGRPARRLSGRWPRGRAAFVAHLP